MTRSSTVPLARTEGNSSTASVFLRPRLLTSLTATFTTNTDALNASVVTVQLKMENVFLQSWDVSNTTPKTNVRLVWLLSSEKSTENAYLLDANKLLTLALASNVTLVLALC